MVGVRGMPKDVQGNGVSVERTVILVVVGGGPFMRMCCLFIAASSRMASWMMASCVVWILVMKV
jgi:hypothetical protein